MLRTEPTFFAADSLCIISVYTGIRRSLVSYWKGACFWHNSVQYSFVLLYLNWRLQVDDCEERMRWYPASKEGPTAIGAFISTVSVGIISYRPIHFFTNPWWLFNSLLVSLPQWLFGWMPLSFEFFDPRFPIFSICVI